MDCKTARLLFDFARPHATELEPADALALNGHLEHCPECAAAARSEYRFDDAVGSAMRNVTIPISLRQNIMGRLASERGAHHRRQIGHVIRYAALAALLLVAVLAGIRLFRAPPPKIDLDQIAEKVNERHKLPLDAEGVADAFRAQGLEVPVPANLRWIYLAVPPSLTRFNDEQVPVLFFHHRDGENYGRAHAFVYILSARQFDWKKLPVDANAGGYPYKTALVRHSDEFAFLIIHTGDDWDWLKQAAE